MIAPPALSLACVRGGFAQHGVGCVPTLSAREACHTHAALDVHVHARLHVHGRCGWLTTIQCTMRVPPPGWSRV